MKIPAVDILCNIAVKAALLAGVEILKVYKKTNFGIEYKSDNSPLTTADKKAHETISFILKDTNIPILSEEGTDISYNTRKNWNLFWLVDPLDGTKEFIKRNGEFTVNIALINIGKPIIGIIYAPVQNKIYFAFNNNAFTAHHVPEISDIEEKLKYIKSDKKSLPISQTHKNYIIIASRSNLSDETKNFIKEIENQHSNTELMNIGSSLKFCLIAEGSADIYPRYSRTMEWDTASGQAIVEASGGSVMQIAVNKPLVYNKKDLFNPWFIVKNNLIA
jgi:3'(2'), 5'-bisphosphate nucleotidase